MSRAATAGWAYPAMTALWNAGGFDDEGQTASDYGLALLLDGMERSAHREDEPLGG